MKKLSSLLILILFALQIIEAQNVGINATGNNPDNSAMLDVQSTDKGMLIPRMTEAQRDAIALPATGLMIFQTDATAGFYYYNGTAWTAVGSSVEADPVFMTWNKSTGISITKSQISDFPVNATTTTDGFMSSTDKTKLDGLENVNISAGENVTITGSGSTSSPYIINSIMNVTQVQRNALAPVEGLIVYNSTTKKPNFYNGTEWMNYDGTSAMSIGDRYQGGTIAYIFQVGDPGYVVGQTHGLIASVADVGASNTWYNVTNTTTGATATAIGTGSANTTLIIASQGNTGTYAAKICRDYRGGGYSDWYLPSKDELEKLWLNYTIIGGFTITGSSYWTSSEYDNANSWCLPFFSHFWWDNPKNNTNFVRAIRTF